MGFDLLCRILRRKKTQSKSLIIRKTQKNLSVKVSIISKSGRSVFLSCPPGQGPHRLAACSSSNSLCNGVWPGGQCLLLPGRGCTLLPPAEVWVLAAGHPPPFTACGSQWSSCRALSPWTTVWEEQRPGCSGLRHTRTTSPSRLTVGQGGRSRPNPKQAQCGDPWPCSEALLPCSSRC